MFFYCSFLLFLEQKITWDFLRIKDINFFMPQTCKYQAFRRGTQGFWQGWSGKLHGRGWIQAGQRKKNGHFRLVCVCVGGSRANTDEHVRIVQNILGASENTTSNGAKGGSLWPDCKSFMTV